MRSGKYQVDQAKQEQLIGRGLDPCAVPPAQLKAVLDCCVSRAGS